MKCFRLGCKKMGKKSIRSSRGIWAGLAFFLMAFSAAAQDKPAAGSTTVATFQGTSITLADLEKAASDDLEKLEIQRIQFQTNFLRSRQTILENTLNRLLEEKILDAAAARQGITREELLAKALEGKATEPTPEQITQFYETNKARINAPLEKIMPQIQQYLKKDMYNKVKAEYVAQLKKEFAVANLLQPLRLDVNLGGRPAIGPESAPVTLVEFSDFQCPYCSTMAANLHKIIEKYGKQVRLVFRNFPLTQIHANAQRAAEAGYCAAENGRFWEMHDLMFKSQDKLSEADLKAKASSLTLDEKTFSDCLTSGRHAAKVKEDLTEGLRLGVSGTPALFINGRPMPGSQSIEDISKMIDEELKLSNPMAKLARAAGPACGGSSHLLPCPSR